RSRTPPVRLRADVPVRGVRRMVPAKYTTRWVWALLLVPALAWPAPGRAADPLTADSNGGPEVLSRPIDTPPPPPPDLAPDPYAPSEPFQVERGVPPGFTGPSGVAPTVVQTDGHFVPVEDRWRISFPEWDRYGK